jgi:hypothetical protein
LQRLNIFFSIGWIFGSGVGSGGVGDGSVRWHWQHKQLWCYLPARYRDITSAVQLRNSVLLRCHGLPLAVWRVTWLLAVLVTLGAWGGEEATRKAATAAYEALLPLLLK